MKNFKTAHDLQACLNTFCETYNIDAFRRADELFNFARSFEKFDCSTVCQQEDDDDEGEDDEGNDDYDDGEDNNGYDDDDEDDDEISSTSDNEQSDSGGKKAEKQTKKPSVTQIIVWLMRIQLSVAFMLLLWPSQLVRRLQSVRFLHSRG